MEVRGSLFMRSHEPSWTFSQFMPTPNWHYIKSTFQIAFQNKNKQKPLKKSSLNWITAPLGTIICRTVILNLVQKCSFHFQKEKKNPTNIIVRRRDVRRADSHNTPPPGNQWTQIMPELGGGANADPNFETVLGTQIPPNTDAYSLPQIPIWKKNPWLPLWSLFYLSQDSCCFPTVV